MQKIINKNYNELSKFLYYLFFDIDGLIEEFLLHRTLKEKEKEELRRLE
ncbi:MAG: hypothetical protein AB7F29_08570 [Candidatus Nitrosocosmicus sp.]